MYVYKHWQKAKNILSQISFQKSEQLCINNHNYDNMNKELRAELIYES